MLPLTVLSTSLDPASRLAWLATLAAGQQRAAGHRALPDLRQTPLPPFDNVQHAGGGDRLNPLTYDDVIAGADGIFLISGGLDQGYLSHGAFAFGLMTDFIRIPLNSCTVGKAPPVPPHRETRICSFSHPLGLNPTLLDSIGIRIRCVVSPHFVYATSGRTVERGVDLLRRLAGHNYGSVWEI